MSTRLAVFIIFPAIFFLPIFALADQFDPSMWGQITITPIMANAVQAQPSVVIKKVNDPAQSAEIERLNNVITDLQTSNTKKDTGITNLSTIVIQQNNEIDILKAALQKLNDDSTQLNLAVTRYQAACQKLSSNSTIISNLQQGILNNLKQQSNDTAAYQSQLPTQTHCVTHTEAGDNVDIYTDCSQ